MYDSPAYVWAIIIAGPTAIAATTCIALYGGAKRHTHSTSRIDMSGSVGKFRGVFR